MFPVYLERPAPILRRYVQFYTQRELRLCDSLVVQSVPARASPMFEFDFCDPVEIRYPGSGIVETCPQTVVVGMLTQPHAELLLQGSLLSFVIMFQPAGLSALFPVNLCELTDRGFDAHSVIGRPIAEFEERLANCRSFAMRVSEADAFLSRRIPDHADADCASFATGMILARDGRVRIGDLAAYSDIGSRQLEREFGSRYGMSPKLYARIIRFQAALDRKARSSAKSWTGLPMNSVITTRCT